MGGLLILSAIVVSTLLWVRLVESAMSGGACSSPLGFGLIGFLDDYSKVQEAHHRRACPAGSGCSRLRDRADRRRRDAGCIVGAADRPLAFPFVKRDLLDLGWFFIAVRAFVIVGAGNAVNLTDGLDGLAIMPVIIAAIAFARRDRLRRRHASTSPPTSTSSTCRRPAN